MNRKGGRSFDVTLENLVDETYGVQDSAIDMPGRHVIVGVEWTGSLPRSADGGS